MKTSFGFKVACGIVVMAAVYGLLSYFGMTPTTRVKESVVPTNFSLPTDPGAEPLDNTNIEQATLPSTKPTSVAGSVTHINMWAWNAQMGLILANGGPVTTSGSLMEKHKVRVQLTRQDDTNKSKADQVTFAKALADGNNDTGTGPQFVIIMGDQAAQHIASMNKELKRLGPDYRAEVAGFVGYSVGEDGFWGPPEWKENPESLRGSVVFGVLREGDWNIAQYFAGQNNIKNNPDESTYDPDALNWVGADDYLKAVDMLISGYCDKERAVVVNGKRTGAKKNICDPDVKKGVVTWTPGDVNLAKKKGGFVRILSTKENRYQMPAVLIGIHKWDVDHAKTVSEVLAAAFEGADQIKHFPQALQRAGQASYAIYKEESPAYWVKYYKGVIERDKTGNMVPLGGSSASNLADNMLLFGLLPGSGGIDGSLFKATYEGFGNIVKQQYPKLIPDFPPATEAANTSFIESLAKTSPVGVAETQTFGDGEAIIAAEDVVGRKDWNIQFDTGKDTVTADGETVLNDLYNKLLVGAALAVEIQGHTDDIGDPKSNQTLSEKRAFAVKEWLEAKAPTLFPENRAKNRRVTIVLGAAGR